MSRCGFRAHQPKGDVSGAPHGRVPPARQHARHAPGLELRGWRSQRYESSGIPSRRDQLPRIPEQRGHARCPQRLGLRPAALPSAGVLTGGTGELPLPEMA